MAMAKGLMVATLVLAVLLTGCATSTAVLAGQTTTQVDLSKGNYRVVKAGAEGSSYGFSLLGIIPFSTPSYARAMHSLRSEAPMEGKATALANVTEDDSSLYLVLFSIPSVTVTADIIEFTDGPSGGQSPAK
jgi:hypothetical protein